MTSVKRILAPLDFSKASESALASACALAKQHVAELHLLHVIPPRGLFAARQDEREQMQRGRQRLDSLPGPEAAVTLTIHREVRQGPIIREIVRYADENHIDLMVLSAEEWSEKKNTLTMPVAEKILRASPCAVHWMPPTSQTIGPTLIAEGAKALREHFGERLSGDAEQTKQTMVQLVADRLHLPIGKSEELFNKLHQSGVVKWTPDDEAAANGPQGDGAWRVEQIADLDGAKTFGAVPEESAVISQTAPALNLLRRALAARATDIHIDPAHNGEFVVRFRIDGMVDEFCRLHPDVARPLIKQLELMGSLKSFRLQPQEGRLRLPSELGDAQVRITTAPLPEGEAIALRIFTRDQLFRPISDWGLSQESFSAVYRMLHFDGGLTLITGPTGAGKTTTVYSMLHLLAEDKRNVVSIEDPVEFDVPFIRQLNVNERQGLTMSAGLATLLRMDPDVVFVGEIRDSGTAKLAMQAANAGKYVFSTLHTRDVAATITALRDLDVNSRSLAANLTGVISQRLVRRLCSCARRSALSDYEKECFQEADLPSPAELRRPRGCPRCRKTGYHERTGVFEAALIDERASEIIQRGASEAELRASLRASGVTSLRTEGLKKALEGVTSFEEAQRSSWAITAPAPPSMV